MVNGKFATAINCIDGRVQSPVLAWLKKELRVDYADAITEPGADKVLSDSGPKAESIKEKVWLSIKAHRSSAIALVGHYDCAGNPVSEQEHREQIRKGVEIIVSWKLGVPVLGLWVDQNWEVELVA